MRRKEVELKMGVYLAVLGFTLLLLTTSVFGQALPFGNWTNHPAFNTNTTLGKLGVLDRRITAKLNQRATSDELAKAVRGELEELDALYQANKGDDPEHLAQILNYKATTLLFILKQREEGITAVRKLAEELPNTSPGKTAAEELPHLPERLDGMEANRNLKSGEPFPGFAVTGMDGKELSLAKLKGKVVLIRFWSVKTPALFQLNWQEAKAACAKFHAQGFEVIGVNMDEDEKLARDYLKTNEIVWPQYFDGKGAYNKLALKYGIGVPASQMLIDAKGNFITQYINSRELDRLVAEALAMEKASKQ